MLRAVLPTESILQLITQKEGPFSQKSLVISQEYDIPVGIFNPLSMGNLGHWNGNLSNFLPKKLFKQVSILEITHWKKEEGIFGKHLTLNQGAGSTLEWNFFSEWGLPFFYEELQKVKKDYTTLVLPKGLFVFLSEVPCVFHFTENLSPLFKNSIQIRRVALIYDKNLEHSYKEIKLLYDCFTKYFSSFLTISIFSLPLSQKQFNQIFDSQDLVHYAGHISKNTLFPIRGPIIKKPKTPPCLIFLNGCQISFNLLDYLSSWDTTIIFSLENQLDTLVPIEQIRLFYLGLFLGMPLGDLATQLPSYMKIFGYAHSQIEGDPLYEFSV